MVEPLSVIFVKFKGAVQILRDRHYSAMYRYREIPHCDTSVQCISILDDK